MGSALKIMTNLSTQGRNRKWINENPTAMEKIRKYVSSPSSEVKEQASSILANLSFPYEAHYADEEEEKAKTLPEIIELDDDSDEEDEDEIPVLAAPVVPSGPSKEELEAKKKMEEEQKRIEQERERLEHEHQEALRQEQIKAEKEAAEAAELQRQQEEQLQKEEEELLRKLKE